MAHAHYMLDNYDYRHTLRIGNTHCFSTATMVALTRLSDIYTYIACLVSVLIPSRVVCSLTLR